MKEIYLKYKGKKINLKRNLHNKRRQVTTAQKEKGC
jgi:hypothetical protein